MVLLTNVEAYSLNRSHVPCFGMQYWLQLLLPHVQTDVEISPCMDSGAIWDYLGEHVRVEKLKMPVPMARQQVTFSVRSFECDCSAGYPTHLKFCLGVDGWLYILCLSLPMKLWPDMAQLESAGSDFRKQRFLM